MHIDSGYFTTQQSINNIISRSKIALGGYDLHKELSSEEIQELNKDYGDVTKIISINSIYEYKLIDFIHAESICLLLDSYEDYEQIIDYTNSDYEEDLKESILPLVIKLIIKDEILLQSNPGFYILYKVPEVDVIHFTLKDNEDNIFDKGLNASIGGDFGSGIYFIDRFSDIGFENVIKLLESDFQFEDKEISGFIYYLQNNCTYKCDMEGSHSGYVILYTPNLQEIPDDVLHTDLKSIHNLNIY